MEDLSKYSLRELKRLRLFWRKKSSSNNVIRKYYHEICAEIDKRQQDTHIKIKIEANKRFLETIKANVK